MALKTINSQALKPGWRYGGSTAKLRLYYSESFVDNEQRPVVGAAIGSSGFYDEADITIASFVPTIAQFQLVTTEDSDHPNAKVIGVLYDHTGAQRDILFEWSVPANTLIASPASFATMEAYNDRRSPLNLPVFYQTQPEGVRLFNTLLAGLGLGPATNLALGTVLLSIAAADPANPRVWGINDPLVRDALKLMGVSLDALAASPADGNVLGFSAASGTYKPLATAVPALHAISHQSGGLDEIDLTNLSGLLATPQIPVPHAVLHENGGADEISVANLSGLLADPQTPLAHASSHISGGSDPFTSAQLLEAIIKRIQTSTGPTTLTVGAIADGEFLKRDGISIVGASSASGPATQIDETSGPTTLNITAIGDGEFLKRSGTDVVGDVPAGSGDVVGPSGATDNAIARFDNTTGKLIQDSNLSVPDDAASTEVGYMNIPQNSQSADYTAVIADRGKHLFHPAADNNPRTFTIPANASVAFAIGTVITFVNKINTLTIAITSDTLTWADGGTTGSRTLAASGIATALKITSTEWLISGTGLS